MSPPRPIITVDCETDPFLRNRVPQPFLWGLYDGERYRHFPTATRMIRYIATLGKVKVYAHNGGKFDYQFLYEFLEPYTEAMIINGRLARFTIGEAEFLDSWNILPTALRNFGAKLNIDIRKLEASERDKYMEEIIRYNKQDCVGLWEGVTGFIKNYGSHLTLASAALKFWIKLGHEKPVSDSDFYHDMKAYYYGGRVQCFKKGIISEPFHVVDINSAYPFAMTHKHPISVKSHTLTGKRAQGPVILQSMYVIEGVSRGALPWRDENGALTFPHDKTVREYKITGWELQAGIDTGRVGPYTITQREDFLKEIDFVDYVSHFYKLKSSVDKTSAEYVYAKLFLNSLYGKFGACPESYSTYGIVSMKDRAKVTKNHTTMIGRKSGPWSWAGTLGTYALMEGRDDATGKKNPVESDFLNAATAASITGFVRAYLMRHMHALEEKGATILYCDTDSIVYQMPGDVSKHPLILGKELGQWSYEGCFSHGAIAGKKLYAFHQDAETYKQTCAKYKGDDKPTPWKKANKGVKLKAEEIVAIAKGGQVVWEADAPIVSPKRKLKEGEKEVPARFMHRTVKMT